MNRLNTFTVRTGLESWKLSSRRWRRPVSCTLQDVDILKWQFSRIQGSYSLQVTVILNTLPARLIKCNRKQTEPRQKSACISF